MEETAMGAANRMSHGWASRVQQHRKMVIVSDGETGFISEVSEYTDVTDIEDGEVEQDDTVPLLVEHEVAERDEVNHDAELEEFPEPSWQDLMTLRLLYFLVGISGATWAALILMYNQGRFSTVYYLQKGMDPQQIGIIEGCMPIISGAIQPMWGYVADTTGRRWTVVVFTRVVNTSIMMLLAWPALATGFGNLLAISVAMCLFTSSGILDACTLEVLGPHAKRLYGSLRLWCAVSWGGGAVAMGLINDRFGFDWNFGLYALFLVIQLLTLYFALPKSFRSARTVGRPGDTPLKKQGDAAVHKAGGFWGASVANSGSEELRDTLFNRGGALFLVEVLIFGFSMGIIEKGLLFVYLINDLGASTTLCGAVVGVTVVFELPVFQYSQQILETIGTEGALLTSYVTYVVRLVGYTLLTPDTVYYIFGLEILHGFTFALLWIAAVAHIHRITPGGWAATMQSLLSTAQGSLGQGLGVIAGGWVMKAYDAIYMFQCAAALGFTLVLWRSVILVVHLIDATRKAETRGSRQVV